MYCLHCGSETFNPKFCNNSCSAKYHNKKPRIYKKNLEGKCVKCGISIKKQYMHCKECMPEKVNFDDYTLGQVREQTGKQYHNRIRERSGVGSKNINVLFLVKIVDIVNLWKFVILNQLANFLMIL